MMGFEYGSTAQESHCVATSFEASEMTAIEN